MSGSDDLLPPASADFYRRSLLCLQETGIPFLVGGAHAFRRYTGIKRDTKDFDLFVVRDRLDDAMAALESSECSTEIVSSHWLAKAHCEDCALDLIFATGNGVSVVDHGWFERGVEDVILDVPVRLCSAEDIIWTKAFVQERERYDGADVAHLILKADLDWDLLLQQFGEHWRVLMAHVVLFSFSYPSERDRIPRRVMDDLAGRLQEESETPPPRERVCNGTLLSRAQYLVDVREWGFLDGRLQPDIDLTAEQVANWTDAIEAHVVPGIVRDT